MSTLPALMTPYKVMERKKPNLSHLCIWSCQCFVLHPSETCRKRDTCCFKAIFIGYDEEQLGWRVCDLHGKYFFSHNVIFNENIRGCLKPHSIWARSPFPTHFISDTPDNSPQNQPSSTLFNNILHSPQPCSPIIQSNPSISPPVPAVPLQPSDPINMQPHWNIIPITARKMFFEDITQQNKHLTQLCANQQAHIEPHQALLAILDFDALLATSIFGGNDDLISLRESTMAKYKAYATYDLDPICF